jgi:plasmid segregation protein ParM
MNTGQCHENEPRLQARASPLTFSIQLTLEIKLENLSIAIDGGHSMFKVRAAALSSPNQRASFQIPTVVMPAITLTNEQTRQKAELETIELEGRKFFFGETALRQGRSEVYTGQNADWIASPQHDVLVLGAWRKVMQSFGNQPARVHLVMGLPAKFVGAQRESLRQRIHALLTPRLLPGQTLRVMVQSQADAPLQWLSIRSDGSRNSDRDLDNEAWGVVEIGHYTTDFALSDRGAMMEYAAVSCPGMHLVYDGMSSAMTQAKLPISLDVVEAAVRTGSIKLFGQPVDVSHLLAQARAGFEAIVMDEADRILGQKAAVLDGIIVGGGGAELLIAKLRERYPSVVTSDDARMMVAEGFCRLGLLSLIQSRV